MFDARLPRREVGSGPNKQTHFEVAGNVGPGQDAGGCREEDGEDLEEVVVDSVILPEVGTQVLCEHVACGTQQSIGPQCKPALGD